VGVYFVTQNPADIPETVLAQLGNRVQHALRAYTPSEQQAVKAAAKAFRANPQIDTERAIGELGVGEALVSFLDEKGRPNIVERGLVIPPRSRLGPLADAERRKAIEGSLVAGHYEKTVDRESAYEQLKARTLDKPAQAQASGGWDAILDSLGIPGNGAAGRGRGREGALEAATKSAARAMGSEIGRRVIRGVLGSILGARR
jgi:DNA helicase HerA-like ATPase